MNQSFLEGENCFISKKYQNTLKRENQAYRELQNIYGAPTNSLELLAQH